LNAEKITEIAIVTANCWYSRPVMPGMNTGEHNEGSHQRNRHRQQGNESGAPPLQKDINHQHHKRQRLEQRINDFAHARHNRRRGVEAHRHIAIECPPPIAVDRNIFLNNGCHADVDRRRRFLRYLGRIPAFRLGRRSRSVSLRVLSNLGLTQGHMMIGHAFCGCDYTIAQGRDCDSCPVRVQEIVALDKAAVVYT
jgi:hypothetical protein